MTLFKQLFIGTSIAFLIILSAVEAIYIRNAHQYLQEQLASHSQDAATSLGIVLPAHLAENDVVRAELFVRAMFDRGYYQSITVVNLAGESVIHKELELKPTDVPLWFVSVLPLDAPSAESLISKGWKQLGRVVVKSHPNFAYKQLYQTLLQATISLLVLYLISLAAIYRFLLVILKPLNSIEEVAQSISNRDFKLIDSIPKVRELKRVVSAINIMSKNIREIIEYEIAQALRFKQESINDPLTGLLNRRGLDNYMSALFEDERSFESGAMVMLQISDFKEFNQQNGYQRGDELITSIATTIQGFGCGQNCLQARINGATFIIVATNPGREEAAQRAKHIVEAIKQTIAEGRYITPLSVGCGVVFFESHRVNLPSLLAQCDMAMLQSISNGTDSPVITDFSESTSTGGSQHWKELIQDAILHERVAILSQPVMSLRQFSAVQIELVGRLVNESGELIPAQQFIPMANRHKLTPSIDRIFVKKTVEKMIRGDISEQKIAINLSLQSVQNHNFLLWLDEFLSWNPEEASRLIFEIPEFGVIQDQQGVEQFVDTIRSKGAEFAVDNFGLHHSAFEYLQRLKPRYIKLSPIYFQQIETDKTNQFFVSSVVLISKPLDISVIALGIERPEQLIVLQDLQVFEYQGFITGKMAEIYCVEST